MGRLYGFGRTATDAGQAQGIFRAGVPQAWRRGRSSGILPGATRPLRTRGGESETNPGFGLRALHSSERKPIMDLLAIAKTTADRVEGQALRSKVPVVVCVIDIHGNVVLKHRM